MSSIMRARSGLMGRGELSEVMGLSRAEGCWTFDARDRMPPPSPATAHHLSEIAPTATPAPKRAFSGMTVARSRTGPAMTGSPCASWLSDRGRARRSQPYLPDPNSCQGTSPHQQGRGTKVSEPYYVGIDVSIDRLDVAIRPGGHGFCVTNDAAGWAELVARLPQGAIAAIGLEPSGGEQE